LTFDMGHLTFDIENLLEITFEASP